MAILQAEKTADSDWVEALNERLAEVFRTNIAGEVFTEDVFFDLNMPVWRFQMQGVDAFESWRRELAPDGSGVNVLRTVPTLSGFVTEFEEFEERQGQLLTSRKMILCEVREGRIAEVVAYCSGEWDEALRARHAVEAPMIRP
jgi:ketosteroid isomerase-like protein